MKAQLLAWPDVQRARRDAGSRYHECLRATALSAGLYVLAAGDADPQRPHAEDEVYYVTRGRGRLQAGADDFAVAAGSLVYVPAMLEHRFHTISEELEVLVFFAPAESA